MGLYCMENLGRRYTENLKQNSSFYDVELFENVFLNYLMEVELADEIKLLPKDNEYLTSLESVYYTTKDDTMADDSAKMADSLAFYKATGLVKMINGEYYLNSGKLKELFLKYEEYRRNEKDIKGESYQKGPRS